jgi:hypothetical protein
MNEKGFYKKFENDQIIYASNSVINKDYELHIENKDSYNLPIDEWYYFDSKESAYDFFGVEIIAV